ncbi:hypothetical protein OG535_12320 [Kitasatospora sp. NBC_00085]
MTASPQAPTPAPSQARTLAEAAAQPPAAPATPAVPATPHPPRRAS